MKTYVVVHSIKGRPVYCEGPYPSRRHADDVARMLRREEPRTEDGRDLPIRYTVVPQTYLWTFARDGGGDR